MNNRRAYRLFVLLAAAGWTRKDIRSAIDQVRYLSDFEIDHLADRARKIQMEVSELIGYEASESYVDQSMGSFEVTDKVLYLLKSEAGLSVSEAIKVMTDGLRKIDRQRASDLPGYSKQSLAAWVERSAQVFSPSELLYVATSVRNAYVHGAALDWGLRKNES